MSKGSSLAAKTLTALTVVGMAAGLGNACSAAGNDGDDTLGAAGYGAGTGVGGSLFDASFDATMDSGPCAAENHDGELVPVDLFMMIDKSSSMDEAGKWASVVAALNTFISADESDGIGVGLGYFPTPPSAPIPGPCVGDPDCGLYGPCLNMPPLDPFCAGSLSQDTSCEPLDYALPDVPIVELPGALGTLQASINGEDPNGDATPTQPAIEGAIAYATDWAQQNPTHLTYIVYATDGDPTGCSINSVTAAAAAAANAANGSPSVKTFVIGVGVEIDNLNAIAQAGGTDAAYKVDTGAGATQAFIDKLVEIRAMGQCKFVVPTPTEGSPDYGRVNVTFIDPDHPDDPHTILYVASEGACDPVNGGWYYDNPVEPHMIVLCPASCQQALETDWAVQVELGCTTITN